MDGKRRFGRGAMALVSTLGIGAIAIAVSVATSNGAEKAKSDRPTFKDFTLKTVDGVSTGTAALRKGKVAVLKFGATWCGWCNRQIPELKKLASAYKGKAVTVVEVDIGEPVATVKKHIAKNKIEHMMLLDPKGKVFSTYGVEGIPLLLVIDKKGRIVFVGGYTQFKDLKPVIDRALL